MTRLARGTQRATRVRRSLLGIGSCSLGGSLAFAAGASLSCGDPAALYRIEINEQRLETSFEMLVDGRKQREADQRAARLNETRSASADRSDANREAHSRFAKEMAMESIRFLVELTGSPCSACGADDSVDWDKLPQDIEQWERGADRYRRTARQRVYDEQRACVLQLLNRRDAELSTLALDLRSGGPGSESTAVEFPSRVELVFGKDRAASVSLAPLTPRSPWTITMLSHAQQLSIHLREFIERGTPAAWRTVVGAPDRETYRTRLGAGAAGSREKLLRLRTELDAYSTQVEAFFKSDGYWLPRPKEEIEESAEVQKLRRDTEEIERSLNERARVFDLPLVWHPFAIGGENEEAATGRIQLPRATLYLLFRGVSEGPYSPAAFRQSLARYRRALDECLEALDGGFSIEPELR